MISDPEWLTPAGRQTLENGYLLEGETPGMMYDRVATAAGRKHMHSAFKKDLTPYFLEALLKNWLCPASPVASNMGTTRGLPISCYGITVPDSVDGIFQSAHELAMLSKVGGGVGVNLGHIRGRGAVIGVKQKQIFGESQGVMPWAKVYDATVLSVNQGSTRRGAGSLNLPITHTDAPEFLRMRRNSGDANRQMAILNHCVQVSDEFMASLAAGHAGNRALWEELLRTRLETGQPYIMWTDTVNRDRPEAYVKNNLNVEFTNICSEITLASDDDHSFVCCLSSLNLARYDEWKDYVFENGMTLPELAIWFLDAVMQEFIERAQHTPGLERAVRFAIKSRALGLGVLGWHTYLQLHDLPFDTSVEVMGLNTRIFKFMRAQAEKATRAIAEFYHTLPEWNAGTGRMNSHLIALAPTFSNSTISGDLSPTIEPIVANAVAEKTAKGTFAYKNPVLVRLLEAKGKNSYETWHTIVSDHGSVQRLDCLTAHEKEVFLTARELSPFHIINQAAARQPYIDQSQSVNLFFPAEIGNSLEGVRFFHKVHQHAYEQGIKTLYYVRSDSVLQGDMASRFMDESCVACEG